MAVLVLAADQKQAVTVVQSLGRRNIAISCLSPNARAPVFYSRYCTERLHFPGTADRARYAAYLEAVLSRGKYDLIIPCSDHSTLLISEYRDVLSPYARIILPAHELVKTVTSKSALMKFSQENDISCPRTIYPAASGELEAMAAQLRYPLVVKGDETAGAIKVRYVRSASSLLSTYNEMRRIDAAPIVQEYIEGRDLLYYALCQEGRVVTSFMMESVRSYPPAGGTPAKAFSLNAPALEDYARDIVDKSRWSGIVGFDIKQDRQTGQYYLLDFNPRFGATTVLAEKCGIDFPYLLYQLAVHGVVSPAPAYKKKIYRSLFKEDLFHLAKRPWVAPQWLLEFLDPRIHYGYNRQDPRPYFRMAANAMLELMRAILKK